MRRRFYPGYEQSNGWRFRLGLLTFFQGAVHETF